MKIEDEKNDSENASQFTNGLDRATFTTTTIMP